MENVKDYRPRIRPGSLKNETLLKVCNLYEQHSDEFSDEEIAVIMEFIQEIGGRHLIQSTLNALRGRSPENLPDADLPRFARDTDFRNYGSLDDLQHRLYEHEENYGRGKLPHDQFLLLKEEIDRREVRLQEQNPRRIGPASSTSESDDAGNMNEDNA